MEEEEGEAKETETYDGACVVHDSLVERVAIRVGEELCALGLVGLRIDGADGMDDILCGQLVGVCGFGVAGFASVECVAFGEELFAGCAVDGAVDAAAAEERRVGGIDDGVRVELGNVAEVERELVGVWERGARRCTRTRTLTSDCGGDGFDRALRVGRG